MIVSRMNKSLAKASKTLALSSIESSSPPSLHTAFNLGTMFHMNASGVALLSLIYFLRKYSKNG